MRHKKRQNKRHGRRTFYEITRYDGLWWAPSLQKWVPLDYPCGKISHRRCMTMRSATKHIRGLAEAGVPAILIRWSRKHRCKEWITEALAKEWNES